MDVNNLTTIIQEGLTLFQPTLSTIVGAVLSTLFLKKNTSQSEFEKIKAGKFDEAVDLLLDSGRMSYLEYYKCRNFLDIAKMADEYQNKSTGTRAGDEQVFDFDWFMRFFDAVGNISNAEMKKLWAKILAGEVSNQGTFSLRTLETLKNMNQKEALLFQKMAHLVLTEKNGLLFVLCMSNDLGKDINEQYGLSKSEFITLEECGLLSSIRNDNRIFLGEPLSGIWNNEIIIILKYKHNDGVLNSYKYSSYTLTQSARQLLSIVDATPNNEYLLDVGKELMKKYSGNLRVTAHPIVEIKGVVYNDTKDLLTNTL